MPESRSSGDAPTANPPSGFLFPRRRDIPSRMGARTKEMPCMPLTTSARRSPSPHHLLTAGALSLLLFLAPLTGAAAPSPHSVPQPIGPIGSWNMKFDDEFNAGSLDLTKWQPNWNGDSVTAITRPATSTERACYDP